MSEDNIPKNLIGRDQEMNDLMQALAETRAENPVGQVVFVEGVGGLGKSALVEWFESQLLAEEILCCRVELSDESDSYRLIRDLFDTMFSVEKKSLARSRKLNNVIGGIGNAIGLIPMLSASLKTLIGLSNRAFAAWIEKEKQQIEIPLEISKTNAARSAHTTKIMLKVLDEERFRPTVLIADNFHVVDRNSARLLRDLSGPLGKMPFMLVCTYRPEELETRTALRDLVRREFPILEAKGGMAVKTIPLTYLGPEDIAEFFQAQYPGVDLPSPKMCSRLYEETGGNPLILQEALTYLHDMEVLGDDVRSIDVLRQVGASLPKEGQGREYIGLRIDHLERESKGAYGIHRRSSVVGEEFSAEVAAFVNNMDQLSLMETLGEAIDRYQFVKRKEEGMLYRFRHALIHEDFLKRATDEEGASILLHRKAAEALEQLSESDQALYGPVRIAKLWLGAKEPGQAIGHLQKAMQAAFSAQDYHELARLSRLLLSAMDEANTGTDKERFDLLLTLGRANELIGDKVQAVDALNKAVQIAENMGEKVLLATALTYCSISQFHAGEHHESSKAAERALDLFRPLADTLLGEDLHTYGICLNWVGENRRSVNDLGEALKLHQEAYDVARRCGSKRLEANAKANIGAVYMWDKKYKLVPPHWQEALRLSTEEEDRPWMAHYTIDLGLPLFLDRQYDDAMEYISEGLDMAEANFFYDNIARGRMNKGSILFARSIKSGNSDEQMSLRQEALTLYERALPVAKDHGVARLEWRIIHNMGNIYRANGELDKAEELYEQAAQYIERMREGEPNPEGFMRHRFRPFLSLMLLAQQTGRSNEEIVAIANRSRHDYTIAFAKSLVAGEFDEKAEAEKDGNFFSGYYIETE